MISKLCTSGLAVLLVLATLLLVCPDSFAIDDNDEATQIYEQGRRLMREGDFFGASKLFEGLCGRFPNSSNLDIFVFQRAKSDYYLGELSKAAAGFEYYLSRFADSPETPYAHYMLGNTYYRGGDPKQAVRQYAAALGKPHSEQIDQLIMISIKSALENASELQLTVGMFAGAGQENRCRVLKLAAEVVARRGDSQQANRLLTQCENDSFEQNENDAQDQKPNRKNDLQIGMVLPLSGELRSWAEDIYNGAVIAAEEYRSSTGKKLTLATYDTHGDPIDAARIVAELADSRKVHAAIGPLTSEAAAVVAASQMCRELPLIIPAATQAGLTTLSESAFQLSPNIELQGIRMAEYAIDSILADTAAIITSTGVDHLRMARAFQERFEQLGGTIMAVEYYRSRDKDFGPYVRDLKSMLLGAHPDSMFFVSPDGDTLAQDGVSAFIDCLYMPGNAQQLKLLLPQIRFYKLMATYLGSDGWGDDAVYRLGDGVTRAAVFPSPFLGVDRSDEYARFATAYDIRYGSRPTRLASLGYDAVRLLTEAFKDVGPKPKKMIEYLTAIKDQRGASGHISFGQYRENVIMPLYQIRSDHPYPLDVGQIEPAADSSAVSD